MDNLFLNPIPSSGCYCYFHFGSWKKVKPRNKLLVQRVNANNNGAGIWPRAGELQRLNVQCLNASLIAAHTSQFLWLLQVVYTPVSNTIFLPWIKNTSNAKTTSHLLFPYPAHKKQNTRKKSPWSKRMKGQMFSCDSWIMKVQLSESGSRLSFWW